MQTQISLGICPVSRFGQSLCCRMKKNLVPYLPIAISWKNHARFREDSPRIFSEKLSAKKTDFYISPQNIAFRARGVRTREEIKFGHKSRQYFFFFFCLLRIACSLFEHMPIFGDKIA